MKKHLLLFVFVLTASVVRAQNNDMYAIMFHDWPSINLSFEGLMQQHDGDFIIDAWAIEITPSYDEIPWGHAFYKISSTTLNITDSLFIADTALQHNFFFTLNPHGEGNIRTQVKYHEECDSTFLHISHFPDDELNVNPEEDVLVPLCEGFASGRGSFVDSNGELILQYYKERDIMHYDEYAARFGFDGTLKSRALLCENETYGQGAGCLHILKESPMKYYQWGGAGTYSHGWENILVYTLDTLFNRNPVIISSRISEEDEYIYFDGDSEVIPAGEDDVLIGAKYTHEVNPEDPMENEYGVVVAKYDLRTMRLKGYVTFNDYPHQYDTRCLGFSMVTDGTVYFLYKEVGYPDASFIAVKMDTGLNVEWKRFCKTDNIVISRLQYPILCKDEQGEEKGIAWVGSARKEGCDDTGFVFLYLNHDGPVNGLDNIGIEVRPYCLYPNPAQGQLHMQYSPDVQPVQVELYDLQGRLVRTQRSNFEHIDMGQLPTGTYTMRVTLEDGKAYSDKVVKE